MLGLTWNFIDTQYKIKMSFFFLGDFLVHISLRFDLLGNYSCIIRGGFIWWWIFIYKILLATRCRFLGGGTEMD